MVTNLTSIDDATRSPTNIERQILDLPIPAYGNNNLRQIQLMRYICETYVQRFNCSPIEEELSWENGNCSPIVVCEFDSNHDTNSEMSNLD